MISPSRCCARGIHIETQIHDGVFKCLWCGAVRLQATRLVSAAAPVPATPAAGGACCDSLTRQAHYPRPTITERRDEVTVDFDERFRQMAREHVANSTALVAWQQQGNKLPEVYRK